MELIILFIIGFAIGWSISAKINRKLLGQAFGEILNDLKIGPDQLKPFAAKYGMKMTKIEKDETTNEEQEVVEVKIEHHHGSLYAFRKDTDKFLGQGLNREELIERLRHEFAGDVKVTVREEDGADLIKLPS